MAPRPAWKGYLKLSLVTCAVELSGATTQSEKVSFRTLNRQTGNAVRRQYMDSVSGKPVDDKNEVRGYEVEKDEFLIIEDEDIEAVQIESSHTLSLDSFVEKADVDPVYIEKPYYLTPADKVSEEAFAVIRQALEDKKMAGLARIVLYQRERPCLIEPFGKGMLLTTLRYGDTVRQAEDAYDGMDKLKLDQDLLELATRTIERKKGKFDPATFEDRYEKAVLDLIKSRKKSGKKVSVRETEEKPSNVINLFDALKKSLAAGEQKAAGKAASKEAPGKVQAKKPAPRKKAPPTRKAPSGKPKS
ncbi:Ku protein [Mesorhizobium sp. KR9-304]|uniref:non-homologous end joining protein Ku n=1 Tax=Mesorhizobium sp. KR9-304 TaxID=3156614 RepID=UPI0032B539F8